jgi:hypothetical protein
MNDKSHFINPFFIGFFCAKLVHQWGLLLCCTKSFKICTIVPYSFFERTHEPCSNLIHIHEWCKNAKIIHEYMTSYLQFERCHARTRKQILHQQQPAQVEVFLVTIYTLPLTWTLLYGIFFNNIFTCILSHYKWELKLTVVRTVAAHNFCRLWYLLIFYNMK